MPLFINGRKARELFAFLNDDTTDTVDSVRKMIDAHTTRNDQAFYAAAEVAVRYSTRANEATRLLSQGRDEEARRQLGVEP